MYFYSFKLIWFKALEEKNYPTLLIIVFLCRLYLLDIYS